MIEYKARVYSNGDKYWFLKGIEYTEEEFKTKMGLTPCTKRVTIDGVEYELKEVK